MEFLLKNWRDVLTCSVLTKMPLKCMKLPVWRRLCFLRKYLVVNVLWHTSHSHCLLSCTFICWFKWDSLLKSLSQTWHLKPGCSSSAGSVFVSIALGDASLTATHSWILMKQINLTIQNHQFIACTYLTGGDIGDALSIVSLLFWWPTTWTKRAAWV